MILIGENIHIISKKVREALENKDENFVKNLVKIQENVEYIDLNVGPARGKLDKIFEWLCPVVGDKNISFDSTNPEAIAQGLNLVKNPQNCFINSTTKDPDRLERLTDLALEFNSNLICLAMSKESGIPKTADGRMEIIFEIFEKCESKGIKNDKLFFDPLVLPVCVEQSQGVEALNTIQMVKESFTPPVKTIIGLSNISNGANPQLRPLLNRVYGVLAFGAGLDAAIIDAKDTELIRIFNMLEKNSPQSKEDELLIRLSDMISEFGELEEIRFDKNSVEQQNIIKAAGVLLNKKIYSDSFTQV